MRHVSNGVELRESHFLGEELLDLVETVHSFVVLETMLGMTRELVLSFVRELLIPELPNEVGC